MKVGRRPKRRSPMIRSAFTVFEEQVLFLLLFGEGSVSGGVRRAIEQLLELEEEGEANETMRQARWMVRQARADLGEGATQKDVWDYLRNGDTFRDLAEAWEEDDSRMRTH